MGAIVVCMDTQGGPSGWGGYSGQGVPPQLLRSRQAHSSFGKGDIHNHGCGRGLRISGPVLPEFHHIAGWEQTACIEAEKPPAPKQTDIFGDAA